MKQNRYKHTWMKGCLLILGFPLTVIIGLILVFVFHRDYNQTFYQPSGEMVFCVSFSYGDSLPAKVSFGKTKWELENNYIIIKKEFKEESLVHFYIIEDSINNVKKIYLLNTENVLINYKSPNYKTVVFSSSQITGGFPWKAVEDSIKTQKEMNNNIYSVSLGPHLQGCYF